MSREALFDTLKASDDFVEIDRHFARFICTLEKSDNDLLFMIIANISRAIREGHICVDINTLADSEITLPENNSFNYPALDKILEMLNKSNSVGRPGEFKPLILDSKNRLYLYRYWNYENDLASMIISARDGDGNSIDSNILKDSITRIFEINDTNTPNYQMLAAYTAIRKKFCVITGGPGTGKTTTIARILAILFEQDKSATIALCAPTGKAAARLRESIQQSIDKLNCDDHIKKLIPHDTFTIHRLLGTIRNSPYFKHNREKPLPYDYIIVDEASMIDMPLLAKLTEALAINAGLILVGDKDQLASVEAGAALGDICSIQDNYEKTDEFIDNFNSVTGTSFLNNQSLLQKSRLRDCIVELKENYRFDKHSGIGILSQAVNQNNFETALEILETGGYDDLHWQELPTSDKFGSSLGDKAISRYSDYLSTDDPEEALAKFSAFRVLCAVREGIYGVKNINLTIENLLARNNLIESDKEWYRGRPVMILKNDYQLNLFNGDIGITLPDKNDSGILKVFIPSPDGSIRAFSPIRLPANETVYAMTIHKSQGSEFDNSLVILPNSESPVLTRELLYTGITRARNTLELWCDTNILNYSLGRRVKRTSGLLNKILK